MSLTQSLAVFICYLQYLSYVLIKFISLRMGTSNSETFRSVVLLKTSYQAYADATH